jgi:transmembrane sensor
MINVRKELQDFLNGKTSAIGEKLFSLWYNSFQEVANESSTSPEQITKELQRIKRKRKTEVRLQFFLRTAASVAFLAISAYLITQLVPAESDLRSDEAWVEVRVPQGELRKVVLDDSTTVWVNANSILYYPVRFGTSSRRVKIEGEAFFEVTRDEHRPFIVLTDEISTRVLGTSFLVRSNEDSADEVVVLTGKVAVTHKDDTSHSVVALPFMKASAVSGKVRVEDCPVANMHVRWVPDLLLFQDESVETILKTVSQFHHIKVRLENPRLGKCRIHANFYGKPPETIMRILASAVQGEYAFRNGEYVLNGSGCN